MDRRRVLVGLGGAAAVCAGPAVGAASCGVVVRSPGGRTRYDGPIEAVTAYARGELAFWGLPGMTLALVDADGFAAVVTLGDADPARSLPVSPDHLFQIGSISKSFAAATLLTFVDEGRLDPGAPLARYLPDLPLPPEPITVAQLLSHSSGLPAGAPVFPRTPDGRLWCGYPPGTGFSYSNTGYELLGLLIGRLGDAPHPEVIRRRVLQPLGMAATRPVITDRDRAAYAVGHAPLVGSRPFLPGQPLAPGPWVNLEAASGNLASTPDDMSRWLRFLLGAARGAGGPILSEASARRLTTPVIAAAEFGLGARYGYGLATVPVGGRPCLHHTGGMLTFTSSMHLDAGAGVACFASVNGELGNGYRPRQVSAFAVELMRAARAGGGRIAPPDVAGRLRIAKARDLVGRYLAADGSGFELAETGNGLVLRSGGREGRLVASGDVLATDHPAFIDAPLHPAPAGERGLWWGETLFARGHRASQPPVPDRLRALAGWYQSSDPWVGGVILRAQGDRLVVDSANGTNWDSGSVLTDRGDYWTISRSDTVERLRFESLTAGRPSRLNFSGVDMPRLSLT